MSLFQKQSHTQPEKMSGRRLPTNEGERFFYDMIGNELQRHRYIELMAGDDKAPAEIVRALNRWGYHMLAEEYLSVPMEIRYCCADSTLIAYFSK
ncbi:MAG: hypothetical protein ABFD03_07260 [Clostridiaceae bacterium]